MGVNQELEKAKERRDAALRNFQDKKREADIAWAQWAATPDGMAITMRRSELNEGSEYGREQRKRLDAAQRESAKEYADRATRWPDMDVRGPAGAIPLPSNEKLADLIIKWGLMISYSQANPTDRIKINLFRIKDDNPRKYIRKTLTIDLPEVIAAGTLTFPMVIAALRNSGRTRVLDAFVAQDIPDDDVEGDEEA
jgi:hypothetical protein